MTFYHDGQVTLLQSDVRDALRDMPADSVNCVVTSPPYWGLRDYGTATWDGGDVECGHRGMPMVGPTCGHCGAKRIDRQLGLEATPEEYIARMVDVFREVRRVLRPDGTLWLNIGDSYHNGDKGGYAKDRVTAEDSLQRSNLGANFIGAPNRMPHPNMKPKDLVGIPWMLAFALRADGWWLRQDIIWSKPNPMPESVRDRCTKAHEYLFLLSKSERYYYDSDAIKEPGVYPAGTVKTGLGSSKDFDPDRQRTLLRGERELSGARNKRSVWNIAAAPYAEAHFATFPPALVEPCILAGCPEGGIVLDPFIGSGTTALVARQLGRKAIGIDLNPEYMALAVKRIGSQLAMMIGDAS